MSLVDSLREFISERLDAAAERILDRYERTLEEDEEKTERHRSQTDISTWSPQVPPYSLGLPQDPVNTDAEDRASKVNQEGAKLSGVKDEQEELIIAQEDEQLGLKQEDDVMKTPEEK